MLARWLAVFGIILLPVFVQAQTRTLAVYAEDSDRLDAVATNALQVELQRVMAPAGIDIAIRGVQRSGEEFQLLVVGSFDGNCSVDRQLPLTHTISLHSAPLADTSISGGHVLPYFRVDCNRVIETLAPALRPLTVSLRNAALGRALARVMAHEIYHIVAQTVDHQESGIAKAALSMKDLTATQFDLNPASLHRMQPITGPAFPGLPKSALAAVRAR